MSLAHLAQRGVGVCVCVGGGVIKIKEKGCISQSIHLSIIQSPRKPIPTRCILSGGRISLNLLHLLLKAKRGTLNRF